MQECILSLQNGQPAELSGCDVGFVLQSLLAELKQQRIQYKQAAYKNVYDYVYKDSRVLTPFILFENELIVNNNRYIIRQNAVHNRVIFYKIDSKSKK